MDPEVAQRLNDLTAVVLTLAALIVALCAYIYNVVPVEDDKPKWRGTGTTSYCPMHRRPRHECREEWHDE